MVKYAVFMDWKGITKMSSSMHWSIGSGHVSQNTVNFFVEVDDAKIYMKMQNVWNS